MEPKQNINPLASRYQVELWIANGKTLYHCYTYSEQLIFSFLERKFPELKGSGDGTLWTDIIARNANDSRENVAAWLAEKGL